MQCPEHFVSHYLGLLTLDIVTYEDILLPAGTNNHSLENMII